MSVRYSTSLASQDRLDALHDASETLYFRHRNKPTEWEFLTLSATSHAAWVAATCDERSMALTQDERDALAVSLDDARERLERARSLGAKGKPVADADSVIERAASRLADLNAAR